LEIIESVRYPTSTPPAGLWPKMSLVGYLVATSNIKRIERMEITSLKSAFVAGIATGISEVRENVNGYLYCTILGGPKEATNVYFGKKSSDKVALGQRIDREAAAQMSLIQAGNGRLKLSFGGEGDYSNGTELFGTAAVTTSAGEAFSQVVLDQLKAEMSVAEPVALEH
jgi:hypothetical protein